MSFSLFLGGTRGHSIIFFYQHHGYVVLYIPPLELFELIECWHFAVALCDANAVGEIAKGITLKVFTPASSVRGRRLAGGGGGPLGRPVTVGEMTFYPSSLVNMGECRRHIGQLFSAPARAARCLQRHTKWLFFFGLVPPLFHPISLYLSHGRRVKAHAPAISYQKCLPTF